MSPLEIDALAEAVAAKLEARLSERPSDESLIDVHAAAQLLGCSVPTVERLTRTDAIPSHKIGRLRRYRPSELLALTGIKSSDKGEQVPSIAKRSPK
jgi:excisionase family DNA binding protein